MLSRRDLLAMLPLSVAAQGGSRPNFVVICTDDQGIGDVGCYGAADIKTPSLDKLAASGVRFTDWHSNSPVCSPSRASLLTGKYPQTVGIPEILFSRPNFDVPGLREGERTLARELKQLGYSTAAIGKWHLGSARHSRPLQQGFDEFFGFYSGWIDYYSHRYYSLGGQPVFHDLWRNEQELAEEPAYQTELLAREAKAFLSRQSTSKPFFLYLAFGAPHYPMMAPERYLSRFPKDMDRDRRVHAAMVAAVDDAVGEVASALRANKLENTAVFFQSDNGATHEVRADHRARPYRGGSNGSFRGYKGSLFEGGMRVPGIISWPGRIPPGQTISEVGLAMDILPTFVRWAGGTAANDVEGRDLSAVVMSRAKSPHDVVFWEYQGQLAARRREWKLVRNAREHLNDTNKPGDLLFHLAKDPGESTDVAAGNPGVVAELSKALSEWASTHVTAVRC